LDSVFSQFGTIFSSKIAYDENGDSLGYGYVQFESREYADKCLSEVKQLKIKDKIIEVNGFKRKKDRDDCRRNLYLKNLPVNLTFTDLEKKLTEIVEAFGPVTSMKLS